MQTTFFGENKISNFELEPNKQFQDFKKNKVNLFDEKISLSNEIPQNSSLFTKGQKNNNFNIKPVNIIKESVSEYKNEMHQQEKEDKENINKKKSEEEKKNKLKK